MKSYALTQENREKVRGYLKVLFDGLNQMPVNYIIMFFILHHHKQENHFNENKFTSFGGVAIEDNKNSWEVSRAFRMLNEYHFDYIYSEALNYISRCNHQQTK